MSAKKNRHFLMILIGILVLIILFIIFFIVAVIKNARLSNQYVTAAFYPSYPTINTQGLDPDLIASIKRGEYLIKAGDCVACHTDTTRKGSPAFAGGLPMQTPFGVIYTPNITPDVQTGIGSWTKEQFENAMRHGIAPDGSYYYPAFPYPYFNKLNDADLSDMHSYLKHVPAVNKANLGNKLLFPFNIRFLQLGWRLLFFNDSGAYVNDPKQTPEWNRGAYLVEGLGHCGMCHTPSYSILSPAISLGAPIQKYNLTGAVIQGYLAPNITKSNLGAIDNAELLKIFTDATLIGGSPIQGPMLEAIHDSLIHLDKADLLAMIVYLKTVESEMPKEPKITESGLGETIYNNYCSACHTLGLAGSPKLGDKAMWDPLIRSGIQKLYYVAIHGGGNMPPKGTCLTCSDLDIKLAVDFMVTQAQNPAKEKINAPPAQLTGEQVYEKNCSTCHTTGQNNAPKLGDKAAWQPIEARGFLSTYQNIVSGQQHPAHGGCPNCTDKELIAALKYMLQQGSSQNRNYLFW